MLTPSLGATSLGLRSQAYWGMVSHTPAFATSPGDLSTLALLVFPVWRARATALWTRANHARVVRPFERAVIGAMTVEEASISLTKSRNVGFALKKDEPRFKEAVNKALLDVEASGDATKIFNTWFGPQSQEPMARKFKIQAD